MRITWLLFGVYKAMLDSKAISPEVKGLFETVHLQAKEYARAFQELEQSMHEFKLLSDALLKLKEQLKEQVDNAISELNKQFNDSLSFIENKTDKAIKIYEDLQSIRDFRDSLSEIHDKLKKQTVEFDSYLQSIRAKADVELELLISNIKGKIEKEVESETQKSEMRIALKLRQMDSKLIAYDQKLWSLNENQSREYKSIIDEIEIIRNNLQNYRQAIEEVRKKIESQFTQTEKDISQKIRFFESLINSFNSEYRTAGSGRLSENEAISQKALEKEIEYHDIDLKNINNRLDELYKKINLPIVISIISIIGFVILLIIVIF